MAARLVGALGSFIEYASQDQSRNFSKDEKEVILGQINSIADEISSLEMPFTSMSVKRLVSSFDDENGPNLSDFRVKLNEIMERMLDEFRTRSVYVLKSNNAHFFSGADQFGAKFSTSFPSAAYEAEEFCKCFALDRSTAAVFHLMRIMEIAIRSVAKSLGLPDPVRGQDKNWGAMLQKIKAEMDRRNNPPAWNNNDRELFQTFYVSLDAIRAAWRNTTMHIENKYTSEEVNHIYIAVNGFLKPLAERMDENGLPLA